MNEYGVFIGRFQPYHNVHHAIVKNALSIVNKLIIVIGSANQARDTRNPWNENERRDMISSCLSSEEKERVSFVMAEDYLYNNNMWVTFVQQRIKELTNNSKDVVLFGHKKDDTSFYIECFQWDFIETKHVENMDATHVRKLYFHQDLIGIKHLVPSPVYDYLYKFSKSDTFINLHGEYKQYEDYMLPYKALPYKVTFNTVDTVVVGLGHVLVVRRKSRPGKGLIALPGGFLNQHETLLEGALRELKEETSLDIRKKELKKFLKEEKTFDHPNRSLRGRTITQAFCFNIDDLGYLPDVKGADDADKAWWMPINEVRSKKEFFFEDHAHIIQYFVNKY